MGISSFRAGEAISVGDALYVASNGLAYKGIANDQTKAQIVGVAIDAASTGNLARVNNDGVAETSSSFTPGALQYLSLDTAGAYVDYETIAASLPSSPISGVYLATVGRAVSATEIDLEITRPVFVQYPTP